MPVKSNVPIRICGSKTRSGCKTCKQRHVKCDEREPICFRCQKSGRRCIYYRTETNILQLVPSRNQGGKFTMSVHAHHRFDPKQTVMYDSLSAYGSRNEVEVNAVKHFVAHLGTELAGCFSHQVWCQSLPQIAQHEPSVWHAIVAISMLDTSFRSALGKQGGTPNTSVALSHYSKAIQNLHVRLESEKVVGCKDVILLSCILFATFECLQSHFQSALQHISGGVKLLMQWQHEAHIGNPNAANGYIDLAQLQPILLSLDSQAIQMGAVDFQDYFSLPAIGSQTYNSITFTTIEDAHIWLNSIFNRMSRWAHWIEPSMANAGKPDQSWMNSEKESLEAQLAQWDAQFHACLMTSFPESALLLLMIQRTTIQIIFEKEVDGPSEMLWDKHFLQFQRAVEYAETYMIGRQQNPALSVASRPVFTVSMDIVMSLYLISVKCRHSNIRHRALTLLRICNHKEGIWDSESCAVLAERMIRLEERGALDDGHIPDGARIYMLDVRLGDEVEDSEIKHRKLAQDEDGREHAQTVQVGKLL